MDPSDRVWRERGLRSAVLAGDERAWQTWYQESYAGLRAYAGWRCAGMADLVDEVVQETWLVAVRRIRRFDPDRGPFASWLRGIAANVVRNQLRRRQIRQAQRLNGQMAAHSPAGPDHDQAERIARALAELPEAYEAVLQAKYLDQQTVAQIAESRGQSPKAVESLLSRARQAFRDAYAKTMGGA
jgi:RNA polymerase sigma-70 factor (ECF subfamily)